MRKKILGCLGVVAVSVAMQFAQAEAKAGDCFSDCGPCTEISNCNPCDAASCDPCDSVFCDPCGSVGCGKKSLWVWGGHAEAGVYANEYGVTDLHGKDVNWPGAGLLYPGNSPMLQNVQQTDFQLNQFYGYFGKKLSKRGWDIGGQVDFMFGTDARLFQSEGLEWGAGRGAWDSGDYYTALPQMYMEVGYNNWSVKLGKFITPMGHEGGLSTDRFFYSLSDAFGMNPVTHSGALFTWDAGRSLSAFAGWVNGEDRFFDSSDDNAFLGGFKYKVNKRLYFGYSALIGTEKIGKFNVGPIRVKRDNDYFVQSFIVGYKPGKRWDYTFEWTLRNENIKFRTTDPAWTSASQATWGAYGINQELIYKINKKWAVGLRAEWAHDINNGSKYYPANADKYSLTLAANWTPNSRLTVRPELRYDKLDGRNDAFPERLDGGPFGDLRNKQLSGGISAIVSF